MRVLLVGTGRHPIPPTGYGGIERNIAELAAALKRAGQEVTILNGIRPGVLTKGWRFERHLPWLVRRYSADVVHLHTSRAALLLGLAGRPYVFTTHTPSWLRPMNALQRSLFERERHAVRLADATIAETEVLQHAVDRVAWRRGPVVWIPHGIDTERFRARTPGNPSVALGVGVIEPRKRWELAVQALRGTSIRLEIVGPLRDPAYAARLRALGADLLGEVSEARLLEALESCGFMVPPSEAETGLAVSALQAMCFSRPVIGGPALSGLKEALLCESNDDADLLSFLRTTALQLSEDEARRRYIGEASRRFVEAHHSWDTVVQEHLRVYRWVVEKRRAARHREP